ncbi:hypothetical protein D043_4137A, partial [Vibrio parahaemolyticus EKP-021]|jgi:hypothetical protein
MPVAK